MTARPVSIPGAAVVAIRTHYVDDALLATARLLSGDPGYAVAFAVDERQGAVDTAGYPKVEVSYDRLERLGVPLDGQDEIWKCGDYAVYLVQQAFPDAPVLWLLENDVCINRADPLSFLQEMDRLGADRDLLATHVEEARPDWFWHPTMAGRHERVFRCFFPLVRVSAAGARHLLARRQEDQRQGGGRLIPNDEAFAATTLACDGYRIADFNQLAHAYEGGSFTFERLFHPGQLPHGDGLLYHSVRSGARYLQRALRGFDGDAQALLDALGRAGVGDLSPVEDLLQAALGRLLSGQGDNPDAVLRGDAVIGRILACWPHPAAYRASARALAAARMPFCIALLRRRAAADGLRLDVLDNLALGRPAWQSSTCVWSRHADHRRDAEGANDGDPATAVGFHTDLEADPWWTVDLLDRHPVRRVRIHNRIGFEERMVQPRLLASEDGLAWREIHHHPPGEPVPTLLDIALSPPEPARYLRVQLTGQAMLHFSELEAYA